MSDEISRSALFSIPQTVRYNYCNYSTVVLIHHNSVSDVSEEQGPDRLRKLKTIPTTDLGVGARKAVET
jgi:hypothetical protein